MSHKSLDCVEMKRKGAEKIVVALQGKTHGEQVEYWRSRNQEMNRWLLKRGENAAQNSLGAASRGNQ